MFIIQNYRFPKIVHLFRPPCFLTAGLCWMGFPSLLTTLKCCSIVNILHFYSGFLFHSSYKVHSPFHTHIFTKTFFSVPNHFA